MEQSDAVNSLLQEWLAEVNELEAKSEEIEEGQDSFYKGSWDAARERAEPKLKRQALQDCINDLEESSSIDEYLKALADWKKEVDELDKRILDSREWFQKTMRRHKLEACIEEFEEMLPDEIFEKCRRCESLKTPVSDERHSEGYRWECEECNF
jgi:hypothetical protein